MLLKVNAKGQITLPQNLRKELGIKPGDSVLITQKDGEFVLTPVPTTLFDLRGSVPVSEAQDFEDTIEGAKRLVAKEIVDHLELRPVTETLFDMVGIIPVGSPIDFEALREETKQYVARKVMQSLDNE